MRMTSGRSRFTRSTASAPFGGLADDLDVVGRSQQHGEAAADERLVVGDGDADHVGVRRTGSVARDAEAAAGRGAASSVPPYTATRSRMPTSPWPPLLDSAVHAAAVVGDLETQHAGLVVDDARSRAPGPRASARSSAPPARCGTR